MCLCSKISSKNVDPQIAWILTRDRTATDATIAAANAAFESNGVDVGEQWFKMTQSDDCVNDMSPSCSDDPANLRPSFDWPFLVGV